MSRLRFWVSQFIWLFAVGFFAMMISNTPYSSSAGFFGLFSVFIAFLVTGFLQNWGDRIAGGEDRGMQMVARSGATIVLWITYLIAVLSGNPYSSGNQVLMALVLMIPLLAMTGLIWLWERISGVGIQSQQDLIEKRKRDRIDSVLRDLSSDDLERLRERLQVGVVHDDHLEMMLGDDGEILHQRR